MSTYEKQSLAVLEEIRGLLAAQTPRTALRKSDVRKPPKPEEPTGLGAVVEDADGRRWLRDGLGAGSVPPWWHASSKRGNYADLNVARVLSEGVVA